MGKRQVGSRRSSVVEKPDASEDHLDAVLAAGLLDLLLAHRTARLHHVADAALGSAVDVVAEWDERIRAQGDAVQLSEPGLSLRRRHRAHVIVDRVVALDAIGWPRSF